MFWAFRGGSIENKSVAGDVKILSDKAGLMLLFFSYISEMTKISQQNADNLEIVLLIWVQQLHLCLANMKCNLWWHMMLLVM